jgi:hypothetical protein
MLKSRVVRSLVFLALAVALIAGSVGLAPAPVQAASCRNLSIYADYSPKNIHDGQPSIFIWNGNVRPDPSKLTLWFQNGLWKESVPAPSDWGVRTDAPWIEKRDGGWYGYFIASRWILLDVTNGIPVNHSKLWNDDWRWSVVYCG